MNFSFNRAVLIFGSILSAALGSNAVHGMEIDIGAMVEKFLLMGKEL